MKIELLFPGKTKDKFIASGIAEYTGRLGHYTSLSTKIITAKAGKMANDTLAKEKEGDLLLRQTGKGSFIVALDSTGKQFSSVELSGLINQWELRGIHRVSFLIGGPVGLSKEVIQRADLVLSLSRMTFTHDMVRMLLLEQLYRAYTIKRGEKYHK